MQHLLPTRRLPLLIAVLAIFGVTASSAPAAEPHAQLREFVRTGKYALVIGRQQQKVEIYNSSRAAAFLIIGSSYGKPLLLLPRTQAIQSARPEDVIAMEDGSRALSADAQLTNLGQMRRNRTTIQIAVRGFTASLIPNPPLLGWAGRKEMIEHTPEYAQDAQRYEPNEAAIRALAKPNEPIQIYVYFGSWCHTCSALLGSMIRVDQELEGSGITFRYYGLPKPPAMQRDEEVRLRNITKLPTGLIYSGDKMLGSIISTNWRNPELALRKVLGR